MKCNINSFTIYFMIGQFSIFIIFLAKLILITYFRYRVRLLEERFMVTVPKPSGWFHIVLNFIQTGADETNFGHKITVFHDGEEVITAMFEGFGRSTGVGDGRIVIGCSSTVSDDEYISAEVDELYFFNHTLTENEISMLSQYTTINAVFYESFDNLENLSLMEGTELADFNAQVQGQVRIYNIMRHIMRLLIIIFIHNLMEMLLYPER